MRRLLGLQGAGEVDADPHNVGRVLEGTDASQHLFLIGWAIGTGLTGCVPVFWARATRVIADFRLHRIAG